MDPRPFIYLLNTSCSAVEPTPDTSKKQRSMQPTNAHWPKWHQRDDSTQLSFSDTAVPLCTASDLASKTASDCLCLWLYQREDKNRYSLWIISHKRRRDTLPVPTRNVGSLNSIRTKQPRRCLKILPPRLHATCLALQEQLDCKIKIVSGRTKKAYGLEQVVNI